MLYAKGVSFGVTCNVNRVNQCKNYQPESATMLSPVIFRPQNPQDEAMCTRFIYSANDKAVLKVVFKEQGQDLTFEKAISIAIQTENAAKVAKETSYNAKSILFNTVNAVKPLKFEKSRRNVSIGQSKTSSRPMLKVLAQMLLVLFVGDVKRKDTLAKTVISKKQLPITVIKRTRTNCMF